MCFRAVLIHPPTRHPPTHPPHRSTHQGIVHFDLKPENILLASSEDQDEGKVLGTRVEKHTPTTHFITLLLASIRVDSRRFASVHVGLSMRSHFSLLGSARIKRQPPQRSSNLTPLFSFQGRRWCGGRGGAGGGEVGEGRDRR